MINRWNFYFIITVNIEDGQKFRCSKKSTNDRVNCGRAWRRPRIYPERTRKLIVIFTRFPFGNFAERSKIGKEK